MPLFNPILNQLDQLVDVRRCCIAGVDDEIGVNSRDFRSPDAFAFQSEVLNQTPRFQWFGIAKHAAAARQGVGLCAGSVAEIAVRFAPELLRVMARIQPVSSGEHQQLSLIHI